jgi:murein DD-endopeptidase MepM/ murein hydrolase activator NlpD
MPIPKPHMQGIYHTVLKGETLWRIVKAYGVDIDEIVKINRIEDPSRIESGQAIFIPGAKKSIKKEFIITYPEKSERGYMWPIKGKIVSYYGSKINNVSNKGIDIEAKEGEAIRASRSGKIVFCDEKVKGLGKTVIIEHNNGYSTLYAHNSDILVACGEYVKQGEAIARAGSSGRAKRPVLHFQIRKGHKPQNPFYYLP